MNYINWFFKLSNASCIPGIKLTWSWFISFFVNCWTWLASIFFFNLFLKNIYLFIYLFTYLLTYLAAPGLSCGMQDLRCHVWDLHCGMRTLSCGMWDLVPWPGMKPGTPALGAWSLSHWTTREVPWLANILFRIFAFIFMIEMDL